MARAAAIQTNFNAGEFGPRMYGRVDFPKYKNALKTCLNHIPLTQGPATRRSGTRFVHEVKDSTFKSRLVRFVFSTTQAYVLEFGASYFRVYMNHGIVVDGSNNPVEFVTPYGWGDLFDLRFVQSNDVLYVLHPAHAPQQITRTSHTTWTVAPIAFSGGPFQKENTDITNTISSGTAGEITTGTSFALTAAKANTFNANMVGSLIFIREPDQSLFGVWEPGAHNISSGDFRRWAANSYKCDQVHGDVTGTVPPTHTTGSAWDGNDAGDGRRWLYLHSGFGIAKITGFSSGTSVTCVAQTYIPGAINNGGTYKWARALWADDVGYPGCGCFHEDRLTLSGAPADPQRINASTTADYTNFSPYSLQGIVADDSALSFVLNSNDVQEVKWLFSDEHGLMAGSVEGEWLIRSSSLNEALTPTNISAKQGTSKGCPTGLAIRVNKAVMFVQGESARKLNECTYSFSQYVDSVQSTDMTKLNDAISTSGIVGLTWQREIIPTVWAWKNDGTLISFIYAREDDETGWARHGFDGTLVRVESCVVIPSPDQTGDELWLQVRRTINGQVRRYVEYMTKLWETGDDPLRAVYLDCSAQYDGTPATHITGLGYLEGETLGVLADGAGHPDVTVTAGAVDLNWAASVVQIGYRYNSDGETLRSDAGAADGTAMGKTQRINRAAFKVLDSGGMSTGPSFHKLTPIVFRKGGDPGGTPVPLFSGDITDFFDGDYNVDSNICWRFNGPFPGTVTCIPYNVTTQDR